MIYQGYQVQAGMIEALRLGAQAAGIALGPHLTGGSETYWLRSVMAANEVAAQAGLSHQRPDFGIARVTAGNRTVAVREVVADRTPFCTLLHFEKDIAAVQPRTL